MSAESQSTVFDPSEWEPSVFRESFLHPHLDAEDAGTFRAFGRRLYYLALEARRQGASGSTTRDCARGAVRDLVLLEHFVAAIGESREQAAIGRADTLVALLCDELAPEIGGIARRLEAALRGSGASPD